MKWKGFWLSTILFSNSGKKDSNGFLIHVIIIMHHKVLSFMKATSLKPLWVELIETLTDTEGNRQRDRQKIK